MPIDVWNTEENRFYFFNRAYTGHGIESPDKLAECPNYRPIYKQIQKPDV